MKKYQPIFLLLAVFFSQTGIGQTEKHKLLINHLTGNYYIYTTFGDPGNGTSYPANGMYLVTNEGAVLFDTPWDSTQFQPLIDSIRMKHHQNVTYCISTHFHDDRTAGLNYYKKLGIKTFTTRQTDTLSLQRNKPRADFLLNSDTTFLIGGYSFETFYPGKGHSPDNILLWFNKERILYGGCFIKSVETDSPGNLADADIKAWIEGIKKTITRFKKPNHIIPGHQDWTNKNALLHTLQLLEAFKSKSL